MKLIPLLPVLVVVALMTGCFTRDEAKQSQAHRDETTETTKVTHKVGTEGGQAIDVKITEVTTQKKTRDDTSESQAKTVVSVPALDKVAGSLETLAKMLANTYVPGAGGILSSVINGIGFNENTAVALATMAATGVGVQVQRKRKKKQKDNPPLPKI